MESKSTIFIISLARSKQRTALMSYQLERLGLSYQIFDAVDGAMLSQKTKQQIEKQRDICIYRKPFTDGEIGCMYSHMGVYEKIINDSLDYALILEDDVFLTERLPMFFSDEVMKMLSFDWDIILLAYVQRGNVESRPSKKAVMSYWHRKRLPHNFVIGKPVQFCYHAAGYVVSKKGAEKLMQHGHPLRMPADILTGNALTMGMKLYVVSNPIIRQDHAVSLQSTIKTDAQDSQYKYQHRHTIQQNEKNTVRNRGVFLLIFIKRMVSYALNKTLLCVRGHGFPMTMFRKLGIVPPDKI